MQMIPCMVFQGSATDDTDSISSTNSPGGSPTTPRKSYKPEAGGDSDHESEMILAPVKTPSKIEVDLCYSRLGPGYRPSIKAKYLTSQWLKWR